MADTPAINARRAMPREFARINELLAQASLPALPSDTSPSNVFVATGNDAVIGAIALEVEARLGLLRSLVVDPKHERAGVANRLMQAVLSRVNELGLREVYMLTESAAEFFEPHGFKPIARDRVPTEIEKLREFREQCSEEAVVMLLDLGSRI